MRALLLIPVAIALSGCVHWVVFGHDFDKPSASEPAPASQQPAASQGAAAQAPVAQQDPTAQASAAQPSPETQAPKGQEGATTQAPAAQQGLTTQAPTGQPGATAQAPTAQQTPMAQAPLPSRPAAAAPPAAHAAAFGSMLTGVTVTLTLPVPDQAAVDKNFNADAVAQAIQTELRNRKLLAEGNVQPERTMVVAIDEFATHPTSNAVVFGYIFGEGLLAGEVQVRSASGEPLQAFRINAKSRLLTPASDPGNPPLRPLYTRFANLAVDGIIGAPHKPEDLTNSEAPPVKTTR